MILIIDDNEDIRFTIKEICSFADWEACEASTGKAGVELFRKVSPSVVLIDYHMPDWDGLKTTKTIRGMNASVPIIILTVDERHEIAEQFLQAGATDFALKPIKAPDLLSRIRLNMKVGKLTAGQKDVFVEKGIKAETLRTIKHFLYQQERPLTISEIQASLPVAYQTVHRYLNYLAERGEITVLSQYGSKGRPKNKYKIT
ncbi:MULTISPECIES: response regulator [Sediminibacillus]|uniref:response regulator n=1 Tax=Sediminibacillus TaxID=482460 RepID=UPI0003F85E3D|nr:response regulator [Sediminibacillus terrae]